MVQLVSVIPPWWQNFFTAVNVPAILWEPCLHLQVLVQGCQLHRTDLDEFLHNVYQQLRAVESSIAQVLHQQNEQASAYEQFKYVFKHLEKIWVWLSLYWLNSLHVFSNTSHFYVHSSFTGFILCSSGGLSNRPVAYGFRVKKKKTKNSEKMFNVISHGRVFIHTWNVWRGTLRHIFYNVEHQTFIHPLPGGNPHRHRKNMKFPGPGLGLATESTNAQYSPVLVAVYLKTTAFVVRKP